MLSILQRHLIEVGQEWVCSECGYEFYNPGCILDGLTLCEIMRYVITRREQAFAKHVCFSPPGKSELLAVAH
jgi:hypothetical protein